MDAAVSASTGKNASTASSDSVTSTGVPKIVVVEMKDSDVCCGFGGTFAVKYSDISGAIVDAKAKNIEEAQAPTLLAGDLGCLMNMAGKLSRDGKPIQVRHVAEVLAGMTGDPPIGVAKTEFVK